MYRNLTASIRRAVDVARAQLAGADERARRSSICDACPERVAAPYARCAARGCPCPLSNLIRFSRNTCPRGKW